VKSRPRWPCHSAGTGEVDESYIGGDKSAIRLADKSGKRGRGAEGKPACRQAGRWCLLLHKKMEDG